MWSPVYSLRHLRTISYAGEGGHRFSRSTEGISRRLQSVEEGDYGRLGANKGDHKNITEPYGGSGNCFPDLTKIFRLSPQAINNERSLHGIFLA